MKNSHFASKCSEVAKFTADSGSALASVVAFVVTVELIPVRGKMTDVARRECQRSYIIKASLRLPKFCSSVPSLNLLKSHPNHCPDSGGDVFANHELRDNMKF